MTNYQSRCFLGEMSAWPCSAALLSFHTANTESIGKEKHKVYILTQCSIRGPVGEGNPESGLLSSLSFVPCLLGSDVARKQQCKVFGHLWAEVLCGVRGERQRNFMRGGRQKKADSPWKTSQIAQYLPFSLLLTLHPRPLFALDLFTPLDISL